MKEEEKINKPIILNIPAETSPSDIGNYIIKTAQEEYGSIIAPTTSTTVTNIAIVADKDNFRLAEVEIQKEGGINLGFLTLKFSSKKTYKEK